MNEVKEKKTIREEKAKEKEDEAENCKTKKKRKSGRWKIEESTYCFICAVKETSMPSYSKLSL